MSSILSKKIQKKTGFQKKKQFMHAFVQFSSALILRLYVALVPSPQTKRCLFWVAEATFLVYKFETINLELVKLVQFCTLKRANLIGCCHLRTRDEKQIIEQTKDFQWSARM